MATNVRIMEIGMGEDILRPTSSVKTQASFARICGQPLSSKPHTNRIDLHANTSCLVDFTRS